MAQKTVAGVDILYSNIRRQPDTGVIKFSGNLADITRWTDSALRKNVYSSDYNIKLNLNSQKAVSAGTFVYMAAEKFVIRRVTSTLSGVSNTVLRSGAAVGQANHGLHNNGHVRGSILKALSWTASGHELPTYTATINNTETTFAAEDLPTLAKPGELSYQTGDTGSVTQKDYEAKTNG